LKKQQINIEPGVVRLVGTAWAQKAITAIDIDSDEDTSAVLGFLDDTGDLHRITVSKTGTEISVRLPFTAEQTAGLTPV